MGFFAAWRHMAIGRLAVRRGEDAAGAGGVPRGRPAPRRAAGDQSRRSLPWRSEAGLAAQRLGRHEEARSLIADELALAERFGAPRAIGVARRAAGLLERGDAAVERLRSAVEPLAACGARVEQARTLIELGAAIRRAGRATEARGTLREALVLAEAVGATALARRAREELRLAGGRAPAHVDPSGDGLTPSERRIAELAGAGQTNRQIADALFITAKSVEWHLSNVYRKLDIRGRGRARRRLQPRGSIPGVRPSDAARPRAPARCLRPPSPPGVPMPAASAMRDPPLTVRPRRGGRALLAERDGRAVAAIALTSGRIAADASPAAADAVRALRRRRYQLLRQGGDVGPARSLLRRLAPSA